MRRGRRAGALRLLLLLPLLPLVSARAQEGWLDVVVPARPEQTAEALDEGRVLYERFCLTCHGEKGDGKGPGFVEHMLPRPRDFRAGLYKFRTTENGKVPLGEDLFRTITRGVPGTAMPAWTEPWLTAAQRWKIIVYLESFARKKFARAKRRPPKIIDTPSPAPAATEEALRLGEKLFLAPDDQGGVGCAKCHGPDGRGNGVQPLVDHWQGLPLPAANLTHPWGVRSGTSPREIYRTMLTGINGTPMPAADVALDTEEKRWAVAHFVSRMLRGDPEIPGAKVVLVAREVPPGTLPGGPQDPAWAGAERLLVAMIPQILVEPRVYHTPVRAVEVRALHDGGEIAFLLQWDDRTEDGGIVAEEEEKEGGAVLHAQDPVEGWEAWGGARGIDGVRLQFPVKLPQGPEKPYLYRGSPGQPVQLWTWKAVRPAPAPPSFDETIEDVGSWVTEERSSGRTRPPVALPPDTVQVRGRGRYGRGHYAVVLRRALHTPDVRSDVQFETARLVPFSIQAWDGRFGEEGPRGALSTWFYVTLETRIPAGTWAGAALAGIAVLLGEGWLVRCARRHAACAEPAEGARPGGGGPGEVGRKAG